MYIRAVVLDGFKSYGSRIEVHDFDPEFTAITGLNGTGKSNILDSICFVLGITNLEQVRVKSLADLVYKSGQAGITKATVSITFDNSNVHQRPVGFEKNNEITVTRQVIVGGKNKYLINGRTVQNKVVQDLFCSIQMNINNPNFLIMQGRITKVLNMKPQEILSMVEEAAGTSMYEAKRASTVRLIEKKEAKLAEMVSLIKEVIEPKIAKLREESRVYQEYQKLLRDIDYLTRIHISYKYLNLETAVQNTESTLMAIQNKMSEDVEQIEKNNNEMKEIDEDLTEMQKKIDTESGNILSEMEEELSQKSSAEATTSAALKGSKDAISIEERKEKALLTSIKDDEISLSQKQNQMNKMSHVFEELKNANDNDVKAFTVAQRRFEATSAGLSTDEDGQALTLKDQLMNAKQQATESTTTIKKSEMELKHCQSLLREKQGEKQMNDSAYMKDKKALDATKSEIHRLQNELNSIKYEEGQMESLNGKRSELTQEIRKMETTLNGRRAYRFEMQYQDPEPNWDRSRVKGMVGKLIDVKDNKNCLALEMCAGGSLYSIVIDTDVTSKKILQNGNLQSRTSFIPMNKINGRAVDCQVVKLAQDLVGSENAAPALSLINYDQQYERVMRYVFGNTFICKDMNVARQVTFHKQIMCRSVTLDGDVVDPEGTLSGGSMPKGGAILLEIALIKELSVRLTSTKNELQTVEREISAINQPYHRFLQVKELLDQRQHELNTIEKSLATTSFQQHQTELNELKAKIESLRVAIATAKETYATSMRKANDVENKLADSKGHRERELLAGEEELQRAKAKSEVSQKQWQKRQQEYETLVLEIEELKKEIELSKAQLDTLREHIQELKQSLIGLAADSNANIQEVEKLKQNIKSHKNNINLKNKELRSKYSRKEKLTKNNQELEIAIKKQENEVAKIKNECKERKNRLQVLEDKYDWIAEDRQFFGGKNTCYDYSKTDPEEAGKNLQQMQATKETMSRNINQKAMVLLQREDEQYTEVMKRQAIVEEDKMKIQNMISDLDEKKRISLKKACEEVDVNFSKIFSSMLPGADAKLAPFDGTNYLSGLQVKVGFNGLWKESLTELSGGQRSLVALSLILAMLKFNPAPIYILDEVDAALDLSHTQNIGSMLKAHFKNSQFIIVSLKDGMFNNANVLFRTKFVDGMSAVTRTANLTNK